MANWTFFASLYTTLITPLLIQIEGMLAAVCAVGLKFAIALIALWLILAFMELSNHTRSLPDIMKQGFIAVMVLSTLQMAQYTQYISDLFLHAIPNMIGNAFGAQTSPVAGLDLVLNGAITKAVKVYDALPSYSLKTIPLAIAAGVVFPVAALAAVGYSFAIYMVAAIINVALILVGPIFLACAAVPWTRKFAAGWLSVLVGGVTTQLMANAIILMLTGAETTLMKQTEINVAAADSNMFVMLLGLGQCGLLLALCTAVVKKMPAIAQAIGSGVYLGTAGAHSTTLGAAGTAASAAIGGAAGAAAAIGRNASRQVGAGAVRASAPTGRSLSGRAA